MVMGCAMIRPFGLDAVQLGYEQFLALEEFQTHGDFWWIHGDFMWIKHGLLDNHPFSSMIYLLEKVFFHSYDSYVQFPEATRKVKSFQLGLGLCPAMGGIVSNRCFFKVTF